MRDFNQMKSQLADQINDLGEDLINVDNFNEVVSKQERHDIERLFRLKGKSHGSVIGLVNTGVESMEYVIGEVLNPGFWTFVWFKILHYQTIEIFSPPIFPINPI